MSVAVDPSWRDEALCTQVDPEVFFPEPGATARAARRICAACPVRYDCLTDALEHRDVVYGVRAGLTPSARRRLLSASEESVTSRANANAEMGAA